MSERIAKSPERKLWYEGPNYTADAVVIDHEATRILLIQRNDTGDWALPGGFVDPRDSSPLQTARREAAEETNIELKDGALVYEGCVDDPRDTFDAWIETSAYLFCLQNTADVEARDDASDAKWHDLACLPPLYASHRAIIEQALRSLPD